jgi:probable phosphoglycerate mutase
MQRAHDTAQAIAKHHGLEPIIRQELSEIDLWQRAPQNKGLLDIYSREELVEIYREVRATRRHDAYPHVEDPDAFRKRIVGAIDQIAAEAEGHRVVIACHGGVYPGHLALSHTLQRRRPTTTSCPSTTHVHHRCLAPPTLAAEVLTINDYSHGRSFQSSLAGIINA